MNCSVLSLQGEVFLIIHNILNIKGFKSYLFFFPFSSSELALKSNILYNLYTIYVRTRRLKIMAFARKGSEPPAIKNRVKKTVKQPTSQEPLAKAPTAAKTLPSFLTFSLASMLYSPENHPYLVSSEPFLPALNLASKKVSGTTLFQAQAKKSSSSQAVAPALPTIKENKSYKA
jgi:hypothetical protein